MAATAATATTSAEDLAACLLDDDDIVVLETVIATAPKAEPNTQVGQKRSTRDAARTDADAMPPPPAKRPKTSNAAAVAVAAAAAVERPFLDLATANEQIRPPPNAEALCTVIRCWAPRVSPAVWPGADRCIIHLDTSALLRLPSPSQQLAPIAANHCDTAMLRFALVRKHVALLHHWTVHDALRVFCIPASALAALTARLGATPLPPPPPPSAAEASASASSAPAPAPISAEVNRIARLAARWYVALGMGGWLLTLDQAKALLTTHSHPLMAHVVYSRTWPRDRLHSMGLFLNIRRSYACSRTQLEVPISLSTCVVYGADCDALSALFVTALEDELDLCRDSIHAEFPHPFALTPRRT